jgi:hypothetical protein
MSASTVGVGAGVYAACIAALLAGKYAEAAEKYARAKQNMAEVAGPESQALRKACTLNLGSCYLNMGRYQQCVTECQEVLRGGLTCVAKYCQQKLVQPVSRASAPNLLSCSSAVCERHGQGRKQE